MHYTIEAEGLVKRFGATLALDGVSFAVETGTVLGVLGPDGVGRTTAVRILATLLAGRGLLHPHPGAPRPTTTSRRRHELSSNRDGRRRAAGHRPRAAAALAAAGQQRLQPRPAQLDAPATALHLQGAEDGDAHTDQPDSVSQESSSPSRS